MAQESSDKYSEQAKLLLQKSISLQLLRHINASMPERKFHEHTHILYDIRTSLGPAKKVYLEIGSYIGSSASLMLQHPYETEIICIDPLNLNKSHYGGELSQSETLQKNLQKNNTNNYKFKIYKNFSNDKTLLEELESGGVKVDILFIDGGHGYEQVLADFRNYEKFVVKGGYIVFDDYLDYQHSPQVKKAVDHITSTLDNETYDIIGSLPNIQEAKPQSLKMSNEFIVRKLQ